MANILNAEDVRWDLSSLYKGVDDPQLDADIAKLIEMMKQFNAAYKGRLAETLAQSITDYSEIRMLVSKIGVYLFLRQSTNVEEPTVKAKIAETDRKIDLATGEYLAFFQIELTDLSDSVLEDWYRRDPIVAKHKPWIEHIRIFKPHLLIEPVEAALTKRSSFGSGAWAEFFDEVEADLRFNLGGEEKTLVEILHILTESFDASERAEALRVMNSGFAGPFAKYSAQTLYMVVGASAVEQKERSYEHPMESRNKSSRIPDAVVDALHQAVKEVGSSLARRYYRLKAAHLGMQNLKWSDRNAPMPFADKTIIPFGEALDIVLRAYESFSPTLADLIRYSVAQKRIDAPAVKGKRNGAFNYSFVLPGGEPSSFTFLNYVGSTGDVMTLAHELGHGVHGLLAGKAQGVLMSRAPIAYCETASVFGEKTTFNFLIKKLEAEGNEEAALALLMGSIDDVINTTVRQISFSNFERRIHGMDPTYGTWNEPTKLSVAQLDALWLDVTKEFYGQDGDVFTYENAEHLWAYISHFHNAFYVYGYAFGQHLTDSLYAHQTHLGDQFEPLYLELLRSGGTKDVIELTKPFNLDPTHENFWKEGIEVGLGAMIAKAEEISRRRGIVI